jgi:hypothetical protein
MSMPVREIGMLPKMISSGCQLKTVLRNEQEGDWIKFEKRFQRDILKAKPIN